jgi:hypothetical protein
LDISAGDSFSGKKIEERRSSQWKLSTFLMLSSEEKKLIEENKIFKNIYIL